MWSVRSHVLLLSIFNYVQKSTPNQNLSNLHAVSTSENTGYLSTPLFYDKVTSTGTDPLPCHWFPTCICRDESFYTNGTYKLLVNCTKSGLRNIPNGIPDVTTVLTLDGNYIHDIKPGAFKNLINLKYLDLSDNLIEELNENVFIGLESLQAIELGENKIRYNNVSLPHFIFKPLKNLERLNLHQRLDNIDASEYYPTEALSHLKSLKQLLIDGIEPKNIPQAFSKIPNLKTLNLSSKHGRCNLTKILVNMFKDLNSIYDLTVTNCSLNHVELGSFAELSKLTKLDLSYNDELQFKSLANISYGLQGKKMREIKLVKIHRTFGDCTRIEKDHLVYFKNVNVDGLYLDNNRLSYVSEDAVEFIPRSLHKLSLTNNMLLAGEYIHKMFEESVFKSLKFLSMAEQSMQYNVVKFFDNTTRYMFVGKPLKAFTNVSNLEVEFEQEDGINKRSEANVADMLPFCGNCRSQKVEFETILYVPPGLKDLDLSGLQIRNELRNICFCEPNSLLRINLRRNVFWSWQGPIAGLSKLINLNLAWNSCDDLSEDVFDQFDSLIQLNLSRNFIEEFLRKDTEGRIFRNLKNLYYLYLVDNKISYIPPKLFQGLESLAVLDLSFNFLTQIDLELNKHPLQFLDLHNNLLYKIGPCIIKKFQKDREKVLPYRFLDLSNNRLLCTCQSIDFVEWISQTNVNLRGESEYTCTYKNGGIKRLASAKEIYLSLSKDCADYTSVVIGACFCIVLFMFIALGGITYRYRWDLRYLYYTIKLKMKGSKQFTNATFEDEFKYDAFISYAYENSVFVMNSLISELESNRHLNLLVHGRDFLAGEYVYDNIMQAIKTSRKTLILMSRDFLKSEWCIFEMNMARLESIKTGRNAVCLIMLETVSFSGLPLEITDIIGQQTYLELPEDSQDMSQWWDKLHWTLVSNN